MSKTSSSLRKTLAEDFNLSAHPSMKTPANPNHDRLLKLNELPEWAQEEPCIKTSYRPVSGSYALSARSLFYIHNETVNIYSHLLPLGVWIPLIIHCLLVYTGWITSPTKPRHRDLVVFATFFCGAVTCMGLSGMYHTFKNHSAEANMRWKRCDFIGITTLIWASFVPTIYYLFTCEPELMRFYLGSTSTIAAFLVLFFSSPLATKSWAGPFIAPLFVLFAASGFVPLWKGAQLYGYSDVVEMAGVDLVLVQGAIYLVGVTCFVSKFPEGWAPVKYDIWGASHQLFHIAVAIAAFVELGALIKAYKFQHQHEQTMLCLLVKSKSDGFKMMW